MIDVQIETLEFSKKSGNCFLMIHNYSIMCLSFE